MLDPRLWFMISAVALASACSSGDGFVACQKDALPANGSPCDGSVYGPSVYCRLFSCGYGTENECACVSGAWRCAPSSRDDYGCGTPPVCRGSPCP